MKKLIFLVISIGMFLSIAVGADEYLIEEMESLKSSLDTSDPDRTILSLRLADLYFDVSIQEAQGEQVIEQRQKAYELYLSVLQGKDGLQKPSGVQAINIKYQLARVLGKLSRFDEAQKYYLDVFESKYADKKLKRESALALAEYYEEKVHFEMADKYYLAGISLCHTVSTCNYVHYKRAWLHYKEVKLESAIEELKLSLFEKDGSVRDKVINDLLLFFSARMTDGKKELSFINQLEKKTGRKGLVRQLVEAFYAAGNRLAGSTVLVELNKKNPDPFYEMRLLEEFYGFRDIALVKKYLSSLEKRSANDLPQDIEEAKEFKAMLKRVIVQFDSEIETNKAYEDILKRSIETYLTFYPNDEMRRKMQQGWLKVEKSAERKIHFLGNWIQEDLQLKLKPQEIRKLRQTRLALAQKLEKSDIIIAEAKEIEKILKGSVEAREFRYVLAYEYYKRKEYHKALPLFNSLSSLSLAEVDDWMIKSQNLILDIYNLQKNYTALVDQADLWLQSDKLASGKNIKQHLSEMKLVRKQAYFEKITLMGESQQALESFFDLCFKKIYEKKSCKNAKVLAVKLEDQQKLVKLLEKSADEEALMVEYELMGEFSKSARLQEKFLLTRNAQIPVYLKIALMYEIDQDFKQRDRILKKLVTKIRRDKKLDEKYEAIVYKTLEEANLLTERSLLLPWKPERKIALAARLSVQKPTKLTRSFISKQKEHSGSAWAKMVLEKVEKLYRYQKKTKFYGRYSKTLFKRRNKRLERFVSVAKSYLDGADFQTRLYLLDMLKKAYGQISQEVLATPLPEGLTEEILSQVKNNLQQMAAPYQKVQEDYNRLLNEQLALAEAEKKEIYQKQLRGTLENYASFVEDDKVNISLSSSLDFSEVESQKKLLKIKPDNLESLEKLEAHFKAQENLRIASYFTGRIKNSKEDQ